MQIQTAAVVGAGNMGSGIAQKMATEGVSVTLVDTTLERAQAGKERIAKLLAEGVAKKVFSQPQVDAALARLTVSGSLSDLANVDLVIEAVFEDLKVKQDLFRELGKICRPNAVLATNTSSFLVADVAKVTAHPERVIGLHYFYHPAKNRLVEVIGHAGASPEVLATAWQFQERVGKVVIASRDAAGFIVNRYFVPWLNEAVRLHAEGIDIPTIEAAAKESFGIGMGPFQLMNVTGVPIAMHAAASLAHQLGEFYAPHAKLNEQVAANKPWELTGTPAGGDAARRVSERLWGVVYYVAAALVSEGVGTAEDTDLGARVGLRWPKGPFEQANTLGVGKACELAQAIQKRYSLKAPTLLETQAQAKAPFALSRVSLSVAEGICTIKFQRPDQLNALDPEMIRQLQARFTEAEGRSDVKAIVLAGAGKAFVAGADVKFFVDRMAVANLDEIAAFATAGQKVFRQIELCKKPVICWLDGLALGGGAELALACHTIIATPRAKMGFPETGLGIYPGLGGTQRLSRRVGLGLARMLLYTGNFFSADDMARWRLAWKVVPASEMTATIAAAVSGAPKQDALSSEALQKVLSPAEQQAVEVCAKESIATLLTPTWTPAEAGPAVADLLKKTRRKAPLALRATEDLTMKATRLDLVAGLAAEADGLHAVFASKDALEGMRAVLERRAAVFGGS